jgi:site-specific DNA-methyltransferase (adenine-specific)
MPHVIHNSEFVTWATAEVEHSVKFHAVFCDPPYGIAFMGKDWDDVGGPAAFQAQVKQWGEALLPLLYPGALALMFGGTRTWHRLAAGMEDAGFEMWDTFMWLHGQGFPKGQDLSKLIDKQHLVERTVIGTNSNGSGSGSVVGMDCAKSMNKVYEITRPTEQSAYWSGHKTPQLKPAWEPCLAFRAPRCGNSYADLAVEHGSGSLNVDGARIGSDLVGWGGSSSPFGGLYSGGEARPVTGRYPANLLLDDTTAPMLDEQSGLSKSTASDRNSEISSSVGYGQARFIKSGIHFGDSGGASRFFYCAKAGKSERNAGLDGTPKNPGGSTAKGFTRDKAKGIDRNRPVHNNHPCVKPINLCKYLATLILPPSSVEGRRLLVPFSGSGSEMIGALKAGWDDVTGVEMDAAYCAIARQRIAHALKEPAPVCISTPAPAEDACMFPEIAAFLSRPCEAIT